jgi:two-component system response regulator DevR
VIRILVVDDHSLVREGLAGILGSDPDISVVGEAGSAEEALARLARCDPQVVSLGIRLPGMSGLDLCARLVRTRPGLRIAAVASYSDDRIVVDAFTAGAHGFLRKGSDPSLLREAVRAVAQGGTFIDPSLEKPLVATAMGARQELTAPSGS